MFFSRKLSRSIDYGQYSIGRWRNTSQPAMMSSKQYKTRMVDHQSGFGLEVYIKHQSQLYCQFYSTYKVHIDESKLHFASVYGVGIKLE